MSQGFSFQHLQLHICSVCKQTWDSEGTAEAVERFFKGHVAYKVCPCCGQTVDDEDFEDPEYRQRFDDWVAKPKDESDGPTT